MLGARYEWNRRSLERSLNAAAVPAEFVEPGVLTPEGAKLKHLFWCQGVGALRVLQNPELFDSLFPGYDAARADSGLWRRYFQELFDETVYSSVLMKASSARSLRVSASSLGGMDIFRKYGADILLFGVSDTFIPVSAGMLRDGLNETGIPALQGKRILQCARGYLTPETMSWYVKGLEGRSEKSALAIWGYSLTSVHRHPLEAMNRQALLRLYKNWRAENNIERFDRRFPHPSWDMFMGGTVEASEDAPGTLLIPDASAADPRTLEAFLARADASSYAITRDTADCDMSAASRDADRAISELLKIADKVLIYVPPTSPLDRRGMPSCVVANMTAMLRSKAGARVAVETSDWTSYGVTDQDYLYAAGTKGFWRIDPVHANDGGARKISRALARRVAAVLASPP
jgi:hypothetical protein